MCWLRPSLCQADSHPSSDTFTPRRLRYVIPSQIKWILTTEILLHTYISLYQYVGIVSYLSYACLRHTRCLHSCFCYCLQVTSFYFFILILVAVVRLEPRSFECRVYITLRSSGQCSCFIFGTSRIRNYTGHLLCWGLSWFYPVLQGTCGNSATK
jgi:hypothetical protein